MPDLMGPTGDELRGAALALFGLDAWPSKVLIIIDGPDGIMASCTEADTDEIRGLMYRAGIALPDEWKGFR